jgi:ribose 5-phosphate isomerase RpiB
VSDGQFDQAVLYCWTVTGISIAANEDPVDVARVQYLRVVEKNMAPPP